MQWQLPEEVEAKLNMLQQSLIKQQEEITWMLHHPFWCPAGLQVLLEGTRHRPHQLCYLFAALLHEQKILIHSSHQHKLLPAVEGLLSLVFPLSYSGLLIPFLPSTLLPEPAMLINEILSSFLIGCHSSLLARIGTISEEVVVLDLDSGDLTPSSLHPMGLWTGARPLAGLCSQLKPHLQPRATLSSQLHRQLSPILSQPHPKAPPKPSPRRLTTFTNSDPTPLNPAQRSSSRSFEAGGAEQSYTTHCCVKAAFLQFMVDVVQMKSGFLGSSTTMSDRRIWETISTLLEFSGEMQLRVESDKYTKDCAQRVQLKQQQCIAAMLSELCIGGDDKMSVYRGPISSTGTLLKHHNAIIGSCMDVAPFLGFVYQTKSFKELWCMPATLHGDLFHRSWMQFRSNQINLEKRIKDNVEALYILEMQLNENIQNMIY